jgi:hypothetical protein
VTNFRAGVISGWPGAADLDRSGVGIPYYDLTGEKIEVKRHTGLKAKYGRFLPKGVPTVAYGLQHLNKARLAGRLKEVDRKAPGRHCPHR